MSTINNNPNIDKPFARDVPFEPVTGISATNVQKAIEAVSGASAPSDAQYYVAAADSDLDNEVVVPAFIQGLLNDTTQGAAQTTLGLVPGTDVQVYSANLDLWSAETPTDYALLATLASTANGNGASLIGIEDSGTLITATTVEGALAENRTAINAIEADYLTSSDIGVTVQAYDADLDTWAGLTPSANFQTLIPQTFAQMRASLDLEAGIDFYSIAGADAAFQPLDADLTTIAALSSADSNFIVGSATGWVVESGAAVRTSLGLGTGDSPQFTALNIGNASDTTLSRDAAGEVAVEGARLAKRDVTPNAQTGTTYTLALTDAGGIVTMSNALANTLTIPTNASVAFAVGTIINVIMLGAGTTSITGDTGVTVNGVSAGSGDIQTQYQGVSLLKIATDTWVASGDIGTVA